MSAESFRVGEIALVNKPSHPASGEEVEITDLPQPSGGLGYRCSAGTWTDGDKYTVLWRGMHRAILPQYLRKRRPPQDWKRLCNLTDTPREVEHV
jgi:hypothetical protein